MRVILLGVTGAVGGLLLQRLLNDQRISHVLAVSRKALPEDVKLRVVSVGDYLALKPQQDAGFDAVLCCLGTTIATAGSRQQFLAVEFDLTLKLIKQAKLLGAQVAVYNSSVGANSHSRSFYLNVKGQVEHAIAGLTFAHTIIVRPSLLKGAVRTPFRFAEWLALQVDRLLFWLLPKRYRAVHIVVVAQAMQASLINAKQPLVILESEQLQDYGTPKFS